MDDKGLDLRKTTAKRWFRQAQPTLVSTSSTDAGFDKLNRRWFRQAQPTLVSTSSTDAGFDKLNRRWHKS
jgi:hypothetical protein